MTTFHFLVADGLALGAAAGLSKSDVEFVIFLAIMLHKVRTLPLTLPLSLIHALSLSLVVGSSCIWIRHISYS